ncbi:hypothetical protein KAH55_01315, partial [bacterium]|nr:hypothetical protein [bacterium]
MRIRMKTELRLILGLCLLVVLNTALYAQTITDEFDRSTLGSDWNAAAEFEISDGALTNTSAEDPDNWNHFAVYTAEANPISVALVWDETADAAGINNGGFALMMDSPSSTANGYMLWRRTDSATLMLFTVSGGQPETQVATASAAPTAPQAGDTYRVDITTDASGHHFACYLNDVLDGTISDVDKLEGNGADLYAGLVLHGDRNNDVESFSITTVPPVPTTLQLISGDNQTADPNTQLADPLVVKVLDDGGDPVVGHSVAFAITSGGGSLQSPATITTASDGTASIYLTLGASGTTEVTASASQSSVPLSGSPVTFTASV